MWKFHDISKFFLQSFLKHCTSKGKHPKNTKRRTFPEKMRKRAAILLRAKTIVTSLSRDIHFDRQKSNIMNKIQSICNPRAIMEDQAVYV